MRRLIVEEIPWVYACCDRLIRAEDIASASRFQNERRRTEHLAWRRIVRRELGESVAIGYNDVGAPVVDTPNTYISVAHGAGCVVVAISDRGIGVDVESAERDFGRAASRYMNEGERALSSEENWAAKVWTAKEALYKLYGERGVELRQNDAAALGNTGQWGAGYGRYCDIQRRSDCGYCIFHKLKWYLCEQQHKNK